MSHQATPKTAVAVPIQSFLPLLLPKIEEHEKKKKRLRVLIQATGTDAHSLPEFRLMSRVFSAALYRPLLGLFRDELETRTFFSCIRRRRSTAASAPTEENKKERGKEETRSMMLFLEHDVSRCRDALTRDTRGSWCLVILLAVPPNMGQSTEYPADDGYSTAYWSVFRICNVPMPWSQARVQACRNGTVLRQCYWITR